MQRIQHSPNIDRFDFSKLNIYKSDLLWCGTLRVGHSRLGRYNKQFRIYITELYITIVYETEIIHISSSQVNDGVSWLIFCSFWKKKKQRKRTRSGKLEFSTQRLETQHPIKMIQVENFYIFFKSVSFTILFYWIPWNTNLNFKLGHKKRQWKRS